MIDLKRYSAFLFDFDGTLWRGDRFYDGAVALLSELSRHERDIVIVSNTSTRTGNEIRALLGECGLGGGCGAITAVDVAGTAIADELGVCSVRVCGTAALHRACAAAGHTVLSVHDEQPADALLVGLKPTFSCRDLEAIAHRVSSGERYFITNDDGCRPGPSGTPVPETGAIAAAIRKVADAEPHVIGKPAPRMFSNALELVGARSAAAIMIGDNLTTDICGAAPLGIGTAWISYGAPLPESTVYRPDFVSPTIRGLLDIVKVREEV